MDSASLTEQYQLQMIIRASLRISNQCFKNCVYNFNKVDIEKREKACFTNCVQNYKDTHQLAQIHLSRQ
ncbi:hypothetical protein AKO1_003887 [Acrasis kona]|uniref:Mitochondrial import inner membrane translocase subunit n=1 Tax=Acrasis kona TaxID=1008807 RepID=A0AAW2ZIJ7_9EUKA